MGHPCLLLPLTCLILTQDLYIQLHNRPLSSDHNAARAGRGAVVATIHSMLPLLLCSCQGTSPFEFLFEDYVLSLTLKTFWWLKCLKLTCFSPTKVQKQIPTLLHFLKESLSTVLLHKIDRLQQILDEMPFSVQKVDGRSYAILSTLKQLVMSVQTLLAVLTLGPHQWNFFTPKLPGSTDYSGGVFCVCIFLKPASLILLHLFKCCLLHKIILNHLSFSNWKHLSFLNIQYLQLSLWHFSLLLLCQNW